jgi:regulator of sigma D
MLNQLENLTERVGGSNKLVDRWLQVRKHLLVAYYNLVGPAKNHLCGNEKRWMILSKPGGLPLLRSF